MNVVNARRPAITAIVCTYNRMEHLCACLDALEAQTIGEDAEFIIVDNNSTDGTFGFLSARTADDRRFRIVQEEKAGLAAARNCGLRAARSEIAAFTDDDAEPAPDWLERLRDGFKDQLEDVLAIGGEIDPVWPDERPDWLTDSMLHPLSAHLGWSTEARFLEDFEWLCEVNTAYRIAPLLQAGGFPEDLGRVGENLLSGENVVNELLRMRGWRLYFDPDIRVRHHIDENRLKPSWFRKRMFWQGISSHRAQVYLEQRGAAQPSDAEISLPASDAAWLAAMTRDSRNPDPETLSSAMSSLYGIGYALSAGGLLSGR